MHTFAVQYLEDSPDLASIAPREAQVCLRKAFRTLPISYVLIGWNLSEALLDACAEETERAGAKLYRWHPLLTGDGDLQPRPEWQTIGLDGHPVPGFQSMPEFTFLCPNRPQVRQAVLDHVRDLARSRRYRGFFLDRIRCPSPTSNPSRLLACFCDDCRRAARVQGLHLDRVRGQIHSLLSNRDGAITLIGELLGHPTTDWPSAEVRALRSFLHFRANSITRLVAEVARLVHEQGQEIGLDCFSPALTWMVGQDLSALDAHCEWTKTMSYGHTMGPAGLPYELLGLADWLVETVGTDEAEALAWLSRVSGLGLPSTRKALLEGGLSPPALAAETQRARRAGVHNLLAGIELVDLEGITRLTRSQIEADLRAFRTAGADGLVLSWDLWHIPPGRLGQVRRAWVPNAI
jgi:hypothetical protein